MDLFDYKPELRRLYDKDLPESIRKGQRLTDHDQRPDALPHRAAKFKFAQHGQAAPWLSELLPHTAAIVDDICLIKSVHTEAINHDPAVTYICTGQPAARPAEPRLLAQLRPGQRERRTCPPSS